ncbi:hypothetical protein PMAYCL1PPCAC_08377, partial [Pristionchus mayeri]
KEPIEKEASLAKAGDLLRKAANQSRPDLKEPKEVPLDLFSAETEVSHTIGDVVCKEEDTADDQIVRDGAGPTATALVVANQFLPPSLFSPLEPLPLFESNPKDAITVKKEDEEEDVDYFEIDQMPVFDELNKNACKLYMKRSALLVKGSNRKSDDDYRISDENSGDSDESTMERKKKRTNRKIDNNYRTPEEHSDVDSNEPSKRKSARINIKREVDYHESEEGYDGGAEEPSSKKLKSDKKKRNRKDDAEYEKGSDGGESDESAVEKCGMYGKQGNMAYTRFTPITGEEEQIGDEMTPKCVLCPIYPTTAFGYTQHLHHHHGSTLYKNGVYLRCSCGDVISHLKHDPDHSKKCDGLRFSLHKLVRKTPTTPQCIMCEHYPPTSSAYANHINKYHKSSLSDNGFIVICGCGKEIRSSHFNCRSKECDRRQFSVCKLPLPVVMDDEEEDDAPRVEEKVHLTRHRTRKLSTSEEKPPTIPEVKTPTTPQCVLCDFYPSSQYEYAYHLYKHGSSLEKNGIYLICGCGYEVVSHGHAFIHRRTCNDEDFSMHRIHEV